MPKTTIVRSDLPENFVFGVATAAYQIEGASAVDGRGPSIWDAFSHTAGKVSNGDNGDIACDHYRLWETDLDLIKSLNVDAYRFSFSWSRVLPNGKGQVNEKGLGFYDRLIDGCLERNIQPFATLYHWDLPLALQDGGGWTHRDTAIAFADYAALITSRFGDRLSSISTFNEPWCSSILGYLEGIHAPGKKDLSLTLKAIHHQHLGHGLAVKQIKDINPELPTGIVLNLQSIYPETDTKADRDASIRHSTFHNRIFLDPLFKGHYPTDIIEELGHHLPDNWEQDLQTIQQPLDFWGLNYYTPARVTSSKNDKAAYPRTTEASIQTTNPKTDIGWEIDASTFYQLLVSVYEQYDLPPCYITENGACFNDEPEDGEVQDTRRIQYFEQHIGAVIEACQTKVPIRGYFAWSLMDNFEWAEGYSMRFGLVYVDYQSQERTVKQSGHWFADFLAEV